MPTNGQPNNTRLYPTMYQFLLDEINGHLVTARQARLADDPRHFMGEMKKGLSAIDDRLVLIDEFRPRQL